MSLGRPAARFDATTSSSEATGTSTAATSTNRSILGEGGVAVGEPVRNETQIERTMLSDQRHQLDLTQHLRVRLERDTVRIAFHPKPGAEVCQCRGEPPCFSWATWMME